MVESIRNYTTNRDKMKKKKSFILKWSKDGMPLSDGSPFKEFQTSEDAMRGLEEEVAKVKLPLARNIIRMGVDSDEYYRLAELEVVREEGHQVKLYGVSDYYLRPLYGDYAPSEIRFKGNWYRNVQGKYDTDLDTMPMIFFANSQVGEYMVYFDHILIHVDDGFVSANRDNLNDYIYV